MNCLVYDASVLNTSPPTTAEDTNLSECILDLDGSHFSFSPISNTASVDLADSPSRLKSIVLFFDEDLSGISFSFPESVEVFGRMDSMLFLETLEDSFSFSTDASVAIGAIVGHSSRPFGDLECFDGYFPDITPEVTSTTVAGSTTSADIPDECINLKFDRVSYRFNASSSEGHVHVDESLPGTYSFVLFFDEETTGVSYQFPDHVTQVEVREKMVLLQALEPCFSFQILTNDPSFNFGTIVGYFYGIIPNLDCLIDTTSTSSTILATSVQSSYTTTTDTAVTPTLTSVTPTLATVTPTTSSGNNNGCVVMVNEQNVSGSHKNSEWQVGGGFKFNRHIYIPIGGRTIQNWHLRLRFTAPITEIEVFVVSAERIDDFNWIFRPLDSNPLNTNQDPWIFNFLGISTEAESDVEVTFCM